MRRHTLLIDADDTLWENNVFFEKLIEDFISIVEPYGYTRAYVRHILNETERKNIRQYGYGVRSFGRSLEETYLKLADQMAKRETLALIHSRVIDLERTPPNILDGVPETPAYLTERHRLILFTKSKPAEQAAKVERSGLQGFFEFIEIVPEKDTETYGGLVHKHKIVKTHGWMIGNSPRSDINPAMKIGLNAVYIPHQHTWTLEHEPVMAGSGKLVILPTFIDGPNRPRGYIAKLIGGKPEETALTSGASAGVAAVAYALPWKPGDEVITAKGEFPLQYATWKPMEEREGLKLKIVSPRERFITADDLIAALTPRTRMVSVSMVRYDDGSLLDAARVADACHKQGTLLLLDASQSCGAMPMDVKQLGADFIVSAGYKWLLGPFGTGFFWTKSEHLVLGMARPGPFYW